MKNKELFEVLTLYQTNMSLTGVYDQSRDGFGFMKAVYFSNFKETPVNVEHYITYQCDQVSGLKQGIRPNPPFTNDQKTTRSLEYQTVIQLTQLYIKDKLSPAAPRDNKTN